MAKKDTVLGPDGYYQNAKYSPDYQKYGRDNGGYKTDAEREIFYYFAVQGYDLKFEYNGRPYYFLAEPDYVALTDENFSKDILVFDSANEMIETFEIDGKKFIDIINELENVETV
jgi:hypothetical protein